MLFRKNKKFGFTLAEMLVALAISSFIFVFVAYVLVASAQNIRQLTNRVEASKDAFHAIDNIRYRLMMGEFGTAKISEDGHTLVFEDPNLKGVVSSMKYEDGSLWYDVDIDDDQPFQEKVDRIEELTFESIGFGAIIRVNVSTRGRREEFFTHRYSTSADIYLRNF